MSCLCDLSIFQWKDKILSGMALLSMNFICLTLIFSSSGLIYLILNFILFFTISSLCYVRLIAFVKNIPISDEVEEDYAFIQDKTMKNLVIYVLTSYKNIRRKFKGESNSQNYNYEIKIIGGLIVAGMLGDLFSIYTWCLLGINAVFALTFLKNEKGIDLCEHCHVISDLAKKSIEDVLKKVPKYSDLKKD